MAQEQDGSGFELSARGAGKAHELRLRGRIYADVAPRLKAELDRADGLSRLLVDARELEQIDSSGLNVFVQLLKQVRPQGGRIAFFGLNPNVARVFDITKLARVMSVEETREGALAALEG